MWHAFIAEDNDPRDNNTGIDWLDEALLLAIEIAAREIIQVLHDVRYGKLAESGKALVLKTGEA